MAALTGVAVCATSTACGVAVATHGGSAVGGPSSAMRVAWAMAWASASAALAGVGVLVMTTKVAVGVAVTRLGGAGV